MRKTNGAGLLRKEAAAAQLGVSTATVLRWARMGVLPCVRLTDRTMRFRGVDLDEFIASKSKSSGGSA